MSFRRHTKQFHEQTEEGREKNSAKKSVRGERNSGEEFDIYKCETNKLTSSSDTEDREKEPTTTTPNKQIGSNGIFHVRLALFILLFEGDAFSSETIKLRIELFAAVEEPLVNIALYIVQLWNQRSRRKWAHRRLSWAWDRLEWKHFICGDKKSDPWIRSERLLLNLLSY